LQRVHSRRVSFFFARNYLWFKSSCTWECLHVFDAIIYLSLIQRCKSCLVLLFLLSLIRCRGIQEYWRYLLLVTKYLPKIRQSNRVYCYQMMIYKVMQSKYNTAKKQNICIIAYKYTGKVVTKYITILRYIINL